MNNVQLLGRLTKDPEVKITQSGKNVCSFTLAVNREVKNAEGKYDADFISCQAWGKTAEMIGDHFNKGHRMLVKNGRIQVRSYEKDGIKRYLTEVIVLSVEFIEKKGNSPAPASAPAPSPASVGGFETYEQVCLDEEIPGL